jgi:membrane-bound serine protease (ClpP class)
VLDEPAVVVLAATAAAVFLLLEVALPTVGLAGTAGGALGILAAWGADRQGEPWWPLLGVVAAVTVWGVLIARHRHPLQAQIVAAVLFAGGAFGYAASTSDAPAAITAAVATVALAGFAFPRIAAGADRLTGAPPQMGMESLVGTRATVAQWEGRAGKVTISGTLWSASGPADLTPGDTVVVAATAGLVLEVEGVASAHG